MTESIIFSITMNFTEKQVFIRSNDDAYGPGSAPFNHRLCVFPQKKMIYSDAFDRIHNMAFCHQLAHLHTFLNEFFAPQRRKHAMDHLGCAESNLMTRMNAYFTENWVSWNENGKIVLIEWPTSPNTEFFNSSSSAVVIVCSTDQSPRPYCCLAMDRERCVQYYFIFSYITIATGTKCVYSGTAV